MSSATPGGILDRAIQAEESKHGDFLRLVSFLCVMFLACCGPFTSVIFYRYPGFLFLNPLSLFEQEHVEGYLELSAKTKAYFTTAFAMWDADFYVKVDDDVHVNIGENKPSYLVSVVMFLVISQICAFAHFCYGYVCSHARSRISKISDETPSLHWLHEIWTRSCSEVSFSHLQETYFSLSNVCLTFDISLKFPLLEE